MEEVKDSLLLKMPITNADSDDREKQLKPRTDVDDFDYLFGSQSLLIGSPLRDLLQLIPNPAILVDRHHKIRFVNQATIKMSSDCRGLEGEDLMVLFPERSDYLAVLGLMASLVYTGHAHIREGEVRFGHERLSCHIYLGTLVLLKENFTLLLIQDKAAHRRAELIHDSYNMLVRVIPAAAARFELNTPSSPKDSLSSTMACIMSSQLIEGNEEFATFHGFATLSELHGARFSEFTRPGGRLESAVRDWLESRTGIHRVMIEESVGRESVPVETVFAANVQDSCLVSFWIIKRSERFLHQAQAALRKAEGCFRTVADHVHDLILIKDLHFRYTRVNPAAERVIGLSSDRIVGKTAEEVWDPEVGQRMRNGDLLALEGKTSEFIFTKSTGGQNCTLHLVITPIRDYDGRVLGLLELGHKVPGRRQAERNLTNDYKPAFRRPVCYSESMRKTLEQLWIAAKTEGMILITGETGAGKDFLARCIHENSNSSAGPFLSINCAAVPLEIAESELFGHEPGAFTGANKRKRGLLELAEGGTLLLNEIGDLPLPLQAKLLTFLDTRSFTRVGGEKQITVDVRLLAATNRDLAKDVETGRFRRDLFFRLNVLRVHVPPLRERKEDLPSLIAEILAELAHQNKLSSVPRLDVEVMNALKEYDWPGNIRELRSVLQRAVILADRDQITLDCLGLRERGKKWALSVPFPEGSSLNDVLDYVKHSLIDEALSRAGGRRQEAAKLLGISRNSLKHHMRCQAGDKHCETSKSGEHAVDRDPSPEASRENVCFSDNLNFS
ncbi:MAG: sigma 54-interacting transcriptional regulator [Thermodesulfobacteriota bacterium]